jgi:hypothetical protein
MEKDKTCPDRMNSTTYNELYMLWDVKNTLISSVQIDTSDMLAGDHHLRGPECVM